MCGNNIKWIRLYSLGPTNKQCDFKLENRASTVIDIRHLDSNQKKMTFKRPQAIIVLIWWPGCLYNSNPSYLSSY